MSGCFESDTEDDTGHGVMAPGSSSEDEDCHIDIYVREPLECIIKSMHDLVAIINAGLAPRPIQIECAIRDVTGMATMNLILGSALEAAFIANNWVALHEIMKIVRCRVLPGIMSRRATRNENGCHEAARFEWMVARYLGIVNSAKRIQRAWRRRMLVHRRLMVARVCRALGMPPQVACIISKHGGVESHS